MICEPCRNGAQAETLSRTINMGSKDIKDMIGMAKTYHSKCEGSSCMCQHRVGMKNVAVHR